MVYETSDFSSIYFAHYEYEIVTCEGVIDVKNNLF